MRRRTLLGIAAAGAPAVLAWPSIAQGQTPRPMPSIGYLAVRSDASSVPLIAGFHRGLADAGFEENRNVAIAYAAANGQTERLKPLVEELLARRVSVIFAASSAAAVAAKAATSTVPIVYTGASDPVKLGLAASLGRPGGNLTGFTMYSHTFSAKRLEMLHELMPHARTIGVLVNPANPSAAQERQDLRDAAATLGLETTFAEASAERELDAAFARFEAKAIRAVYLVDDPLFGTLEGHIVARALKQSIGLISTLQSFAVAGALASYGADFAQLFRYAGVYVGRILKGESPADLPIGLPTRFMLTLNLKTAKAIDCDISPAVLGRADEAIE